MVKIKWDGGYTVVLNRRRVQPGEIVEVTQAQADELLARPNNEWVLPDLIPTKPPTPTGLEAD